MKAGMRILLLLLVIAIGLGFAIWWFRYRTVTYPTLIECDSDPERIELPLRYDSSIGVFRSQIRLGDLNGNSIPFSVIPDTGSSILIVSGPECSGCPSDGVWNPELGFPGEGHGRIRYGGGQANTYRPWQAHLLTGERATPVNFGMVTSATSPDSRPVNVMGIQETPHGFLSTICGEKTVVFDFPRGKLYLGSADDVLYRPNQTRHYEFTMHRPSRGPAYPKGRILGMWLDGIPVPHPPKWGLLDTGTTNTFLNGPVGSQLQSARRVEIEFEAVTDPHHPDINSSNRIIFESPPGSVETNVLDIPDTLLIGNRWLRQYGVGFLHDSDRFILFS